MGMGGPMKSSQPAMGGKGHPNQQYTPGTFGPQNPQGVMALQNAYHQFNTSAPPPPNPMFGQQPMGNPQGAPLGGGMQPQGDPLAGLAPPHYSQGALAFNPSTQQAPTLGAQLMGTAPHITPQPPSSSPVAALMSGMPLMSGGPHPRGSFTDQQTMPPQVAALMSGMQHPQAQPMGQYADIARQQQMQQQMGMPMAPATQQTRPEDPRMAAMRNMQRMKLGGG